MVEEAIRNGTWVPPAPANTSRSPRVDLSKKPILWDAYIGKDGGLVGYGKDGAFYSAGGAGSEKISNAWRADSSTVEWDAIRPFSAAYVGPESDSPPPATPIPLPTTASLANELPLRLTARERSRRIFSRVAQAFNPTPVQTSPLPAPVVAGQRIGLNSRTPSSIGQGNRSTADIPMTELPERGDMPPAMRVAVLIAMPSRSASQASSSRPSSSAGSHPTPTPSHPLEATPRIQSAAREKDGEKPLPHLEVGVAEVVVVPEHSSTGGLDINRKASVGSRGSEDSS
ncbi:hypothetical protein NLJ89_g5063 [Agrocybe chaxingu]|uniref:Uncharacterized protein n=1 Tax=Agrocybe chaxingu TaxID=84603 RepID=A0A9W8K8U4_9AGAR|nr:hypothetical protein NLJ89_g5063 [Agrocybe chaxingu]